MSTTRNTKGQFARRKGAYKVTVACRHCDNPVERTPKEITRAINTFCSHRCSSDWAKLNPYRKGGRAIPGKPVGLHRNTDDVLRQRTSILYDAIPGGCWIWKGGLDAHGYGRFWDGSTNVRAHRLIYQLRVGPIQKGLVIDHLCRVPACVNPEHLEPVTVLENTRRGVGPAAINAKKTHCRNGHEFSVTNTIRDKKGKRYCRICVRANRRARYLREVSMNSGATPECFTLDQLTPLK